MVKRWKILIICLLLLISYSIYESGKVNAHIDSISKALSPYDIYGDSYIDLSLVGADDTESVKKSIMELSDITGVSLTLSYVDPGDERNPKYYWYLKNKKYLSTNTGLNKNIDLETFNLLNEPITNHAEDEYHFNFPLDTYTYRIYPFVLYDKSNLSTQITIFSESEQKIDEFISGLEIKGIMHIVEDSSYKYERTFWDTLVFTIFQNPLAPLTFGLFLIIIFVFIYQDRRDLSIKLVNGYSKTRYILEINKKILGIGAITFISGFLGYYLLSFHFNFSHLTSILLHYIPTILIINLLVVVYVSIIVYSFTDIKQNTYVQGVGSKTFTSYIIAFAKFTIGLLICVSLIPSIFQIIDSISIYQSISQQSSKYSDVYYLNSTGDYLTSMMEKSDEIVENLEKFDNVMYIQAGYPGEGEETKYKVVYANDNYIKSQKILDENKNLIDSNKKNVVYTKAHNIKGIEYLKEPATFLCESKEDCLDVEVVVIDNDAELIFYNIDPFFNDKLISQDFVLVPRSENLFILDFFFIFQNDNQLNEMRNHLKGIVDIESIYFSKVIDNWTRDLSLYRKNIIRDLITIINYLIIIVILSLIYYQIKFDKVRKVFSIYWVNGISKFNHFYADYFYQIIISSIIILLVKKIFYPDLSFLLTIILLLTFIIIDTVSLIIFRYKFYSQLQKNVKEQT